MKDTMKRTMTKVNVTNLQQPTYQNTARLMLAQIVHGSGKFKEVAMALWPNSTVENALSYFSRALSPHDDMRLDVDSIVTIAEVTKNDDFLFWLCEALGYSQPQKKPSPDLETELKELRQFKDNIQKTLTQLEMF